MKRKCVSLLLAFAIAGSNLFETVYSGSDKNTIVCSAASYQISENGLDLIKSFEGFTQYAMWDYHQWSIGYGTGVDKDAYPDGITEAEADRLLREVVVVFEKFVNNFLTKYGLTVTQNQYDALVSFTYNMGNVWNNTSEVTIRTYLINGIENYTPEQITDAFKLWCKAGGEVLPGLVRRRETEAALFLSDIDYTVKETGEKWRITSTTGVRLRTGPDTNSEIINVIPYNETFKVGEKKESGGFIWGRTEYGGMSGILTMTDLLEEIVGDFDGSEDKPVLMKLSDDTWTVPGLMPLTDVCEALDITLPSDEYDTFGGYVISKLGSIPDDNSKTEFDSDGLHIELQKVCNHRIELCKVVKLPKA